MKTDREVDTSKVFGNQNWCVDNIHSPINIDNEVIIMNSKVSAIFWHFDSMTNLKIYYQGRIKHTYKETEIDWKWFIYWLCYKLYVYYTITTLNVQRGIFNKLQDFSFNFNIHGKWRSLFTYYVEIIFQKCCPDLSIDQKLPKLSNLKRWFFNILKVIPSLGKTSENWWIMNTF